MYIFFFVLPLAGQTGGPPKPETAYALSAAPVFGFLYGQSEELVYKQAKNSTLLSQLIWEIKPLFLLGASLDLDRRYPMEKWGFFVNLTAQFSIPLKTGTMEDRDWLALGSQLSHFSSHDNYTYWAMFFDVSGGFSLPLRSQMLFKFYAALNYMQFKWAARDGYHQYGSDIGGSYSPWTKDLKKISDSGPVIFYTQNWFIITPGISLYIPLYRFFSVNIDFQISPLVFCLDQDNHIQRGLQFNDYMFGGVFFEPRGAFVLSLHKKIALSAYVSYRVIKDLRGYIVQKDLNSSIAKTYQDQAGAAYSALGGGLSLKIRF
ncbi:MAG: omptin family outer membrane protease [Spirochaetaceae bacterium]|jgi:outer membrane protease|nr:omptin family outer membrane protease [Spirochaetaceae bacterium]